MSPPDETLSFSDLVQRGSEPGDILLVEDEAEVRKSLERLVSKFGHRVKSAASAEAADNWLQSQRFDLCLLDIELPKMKGVEFLRWAQGRDPEMAVIMLTGVDDPEVALDCIDTGARTYLVKPVEAEFLRVALRDALGVRRLLVERNELIRARGG